MANLRVKLLGVLPFLFLVVLFWKPVLLDGKTIIHGDSITDGFSMLALQVNSFGHLGQLLWADGVYGGHPLFAEGQGGFASPFNVILAWIVAPLLGLIVAMNLGHWALMIVAGVGIIGLCRSLGASQTSACFAAIAVVFSAVWIGAAQNMTIYGALAWAPWAFWALEEWLTHPTAKQAILLGSAVAMIILSGYPQAFHGAVLYMLLTLAVAPFQAGTRRQWLSNLRVRVAGGVLAGLVCIGLSAIQWLPLLELAGLSHRSDGIGLVMRAPLAAFARGLLFTWPRLVGSGYYFPGIGSLLVTALASLAFVVTTPSRVKGHMLAALILLQFGAGDASPLFRLVYQYGLVPGLRYFRTVHLYINIAIIGFGMMAAFALDGLRRLTGFRRDHLSVVARSDIFRVAAGLALLAGWGLATVLFWVPDLKWANFGVALAATAGVGILVAAGRQSWVPAFAVVLLVGECLNLRVHQFRFYDPAALAKPASAAAMLAAADRTGGRLFDDSLASGYGFHDSRDPAVFDQVRRLMEIGAPMTCVVWGLRSMNGALALPMRKQIAVERRMRDEIEGKKQSPTGSRFIDILAVRFIGLDQPTDTPALRPFWSDPPLGVYIAENTAARSRFQLYTHHIAVGSPEEAFDAMSAWTKPTLVIEQPPDSRQAEPADSDDGASGSGGSFDILKAKSTEYRVDVVADRPAWFFIADANYPGWSARLDGKRVPLFSAQLLGKAVAVPQGRHRLEVTFTSSTFIVGLSISAFTLLSVVLAPWAFRRRWTGLA